MKHMQPIAIDFGSLLTIAELFKKDYGMVNYSALLTIMRDFHKYYDSVGWLSIPINEFVTAMEQMGIHSEPVIQIKRSGPLKITSVTRPFKWVNPQIVKFVALNYDDHVHLFIRLNDYFYKIFFDVLANHYRAGNLFDFILNGMVKPEFIEAINLVHEKLESER